jgi:hypothetical protein
VESISERQVGRYLEEADQPHRSGYWLNPPTVRSNSRSKISAHNRPSPMCEQDELTISLDEMTGIQALERTMPDIPMKPGRIVGSLNINGMAPRV